MPELIVIFALGVCAPMWLLFHYMTKWRTAKGLTAEDEKMLGEIWESTTRMEERIQTLERILDSEAPRWRTRHD